MSRCKNTNKQINFKQRLSLDVLNWRERMFRNSQPCNLYVMRFCLGNLGSYFSISFVGKFVSVQWVRILMFICPCVLSLLMFIRPCVYLFLCDKFVTIYVLTEPFRNVFNLILFYFNQSNFLRIWYIHYCQYYPWREIRYIYYCSYYHSWLTI